jgi:N-acetylglucosaminyldiphosphoundecaprenol N-acetyl-beta-D-mannosaminyltransferase
LEAKVPGTGGLEGRVTVGGVDFDALTEDHVVRHVRAALDDGAGGWILTPNVDILRRLRRDPTARAAVDDSSIVVADGMPVVWASRLAGTPLPQRVCGSDLIWSLSRGLAEDNRSVYILGGEPRPGIGRSGMHRGPSTRPSARHAGDRRNAGPRHALTSRYPVNEPHAWSGDLQANGDGAHRAAARLKAACPGLRVAGATSPPYGFDRDPETLEAIRRDLVAARPDLVLVGVGFPRQEKLIADLRARLPHAWFLGCGMAIGFVAGQQRRAPVWMRRTGVEWVHRLAAEPRRLADRYLRQDLPFAVALLSGAALSRVRPPAGRTVIAGPRRPVPALRNESWPAADHVVSAGRNERRRHAR